jgi:tetratricopeptide (TPR) repeat protein
MLRRNIVLTVASVAVLLGASLAVAAQTGELRGHVLIAKADGQKVPLGEAAVDVYRTDLKGTYPTKTNKKGEFVFAGLPYVGTYTVVISHPTAHPTWQADIKAGRGVDYEFVLSPGDGRRPTLDEIKAAMAASGTPVSGSSGESAADRAKREEALKKNEEIMARNKKAEESNAILQRTFKAGNAAIQAKNYDEAIRQYDEGIAADPEHPGAPSLMTNKSIALRSRGIDRFNAGIKLTDDAARTAAIEAAKKDWKDAAEISSKAVAALKASPPTEPTEMENHKKNLYFAQAARSEAMQLFVKRVDPAQVDAGTAAMQEYIAAETDPISKAKAERALAQMLFEAGALDKAQAEYQKLIDKDPNDADALANMGLILFSVGAGLEGEGKKDEAKAKYQEAANFLQQFVNKAPDTHALKAEAQQVLENLKNQQDVKAEKAPPPRRRRP